MLRPRVVVLSGAGISAESGLKTFRDAGGLWEGHNVMDVATPQAFAKNPKLVLQFYNERRRQLLKAQPNKAHQALVNLEEKYDVHVITQNVDDLHERAGSTQVLHLHGELLKARSTQNDGDIMECTKDLKIGDLCKNGFQLRPHIVWFGEAVPLLEKAATLVSKADYIIFVGTSMQVYPAASLIDYAPVHTHTFVVDPKPQLNAAHANTTVFEENATSGIQKVVEKLLQECR
ncbi:SIR2 family NAD-dependent protein deacylase [Dokdonia sp. Hel_I_53]|uniref:SIR2 family NAD-dependent protein deacylase n=1 Tax=Dokdonia sp. Hel_I_53 TaxID=1566287 RepID=UPI00119B1A7A|nr:NAD-dependent deacylase [Dokdonia sp. Hel_I_53]TVZ51515.1 NAD-dependent deacetylase [Dokdonia sp. Hel_I_53]